MRWPCSAAACIVLWCIVALPVLLWAIAGGRLVELHRDWAVFELAENGSRRIFERRRLDVGDVRLPWIVA